MELVVALVAGLFGILNTYLLTRDRGKVKDIHKQVTQNGGLSDPPTVLDKLAVLSADIRGIDNKLDAHITWHAHKENA